MNSQVEEIKGRIDIVDLVGSYVRLQKTGANFRALCPFHSEKTPSFNVSPARRIWHCFGCGKGGDAFEFVQQIEGVEFVDALKTLADRAGVELKREDPQFRTERNRQFLLLEEAAKFFESQLQDRAAPSPSDYLKSRGLTDETIKDFRLGYAPDEWRSLSPHLKSKGFSDGELEKSGLVVRSGKDAFSYYDRFRGRIMFPIFDYNGRVVAFGGRLLEVPTPVVGTPTESVGAKYVNSPETLLYNKSKVLYGLNKSKQEILRAGECVLVEGYMDMIMSYQAGVKNVAAVSGTALTSDHLKSIKRLAEKLIVGFDVDAAGEGASKRSISLALEHGLDVRVAGELGGGLKDPADAVSRDPAIWRRAVGSTRHIVEFYMDSVLKRHNVSSSEAKREFQKVVLPVVASLPELELAHWMGEIGNVLGIREEAVWAALQKHRAQTAISQPAEKSQTKEESANAQNQKTRKELLEERVLSIIAEYPALAAKLDPMFEAIEQKNKTSIFAELFLSGLAEAELELAKCQRELKKEYLREHLESLSREIGKTERSREGDLKTLLTEFHRISKELAKI